MARSGLVVSVALPELRIPKSKFGTLDVMTAEHTANDSQRSRSLKLAAMTRVAALIFSGLLLAAILLACSKSDTDATVAIPATTASSTVSSSQGDRQWIDAWRDTAHLSITRAGTAAVAHNGFLYVIGGVDEFQILGNCYGKARHPVVIGKVVILVL